MEIEYEREREGMRYVIFLHWHPTEVRLIQSQYKNIVHMTVPFYRFYTVKNTQYECLYDANYTVYRTTG